MALWPGIANATHAAVASCNLQQPTWLSCTKCIRNRSQLANSWRSWTKPAAFSTSISVSIPVHSTPPAAALRKPPINHKRIYGHQDGVFRPARIGHGCSGASCPFNLSKWLAIEIETKITQSEYDVGAAKHKCFQMHRALKEGFGFSVRPLELVLSY